MTEYKLPPAMRVSVAKRLPAGLQGSSFDMASDLVAQLSAYVLQDRGGETVEHTDLVRSKARPWWIPRWVWNRLHEIHTVVSLSVTPVWIFPEWAYSIPPEMMGRPVRFLIEESGRRSTVERSIDN